MNAIDVMSACILIRQFIRSNQQSINLMNLPRVRAAPSKLQRDKGLIPIYTRISQSADPMSYIVANFVYTNDSAYVKQFTTDNFNRYMFFKRHLDFFEKEIKTLDMPLNHLIRSFDSTTPIILTYLRDKKVDMMVVLILNQLLRFTDRWKTMAFCEEKDDKKLVNRIEKLGKLIRLDNDSDKYKEVIIRHFENLTA